MKLLILLLLNWLFILQIYAVPADCKDGCDDERLIYEQLSCKPIYGNKTQCPTAYDCPKYEIIDGQCLYNGKYYSYYDEIPDVPHRSSCSCDETSPPYNELQCAEVDCGFWWPSDLCQLEDNPECNYDNDKCYSAFAGIEDICPTSVKCEPFSDVTCSNGKETYREGQIFAGNHCYTCLCQKEFKMEEPFCKKLNCNLELNSEYSNRISKKCAPFYNGESAECCPKGFLCPEHIVGYKVETKKSEYNGTCDFNGRKIRASDEISGKYGKNDVKCRCEVPPLLTCRIY